MSIINLDYSYLLYFPYKINIWRHNLSKTTSKIYDTNGLNPVITNDTYTYNTYNLLSSTTTSRSDGTTSSVTYNYPGDFSTVPYTTMVQKHILSPVIESETLLTNGSITKITDATFRQYVEFYGKYKTELVKKLETTSPIPSGNTYNMKEAISYDYNSNGRMILSQPKDGMTTAYIWGYRGQYPVAKIENAKPQTMVITPVNVWKTVEIPMDKQSGAKSYSFQHSGNDVELQLLFAYPSEYVYYTINSTGCTGPCKAGYLCNGGNYSFCQGDYQYFNLPAGDYTLNITPEGLNNPTRVRLSYYKLSQTETITGECFYEGFEDHPSATKGNAFAGEKYYQGNYQLPPMSLSSNRTYFIDYRYLDGNKWKYIRKSYLAGMTLSDGTAIDEVRVYPVDAMMTTYTYKPLVGISSETDPSGRTTFYEYDIFGRLKSVKDEEKKIVKVYQYNYAQ